MKEADYLKCLMKLLPNSRPTPRSGGIRGFGGDIDCHVYNPLMMNTMRYAVEVKVSSVLGKMGRDTFKKISREALERTKRPILIDDEVAILKIDDLSEMLRTIDDLSAKIEIMEEKDA